MVDLELTGGFPTASGSSHSGGIVVIRGLTGTGKTALLGALAAAGEQVLDLETLAHHSGSAFGHLARADAQPSHAEFQRCVREALAAADGNRPLWIEDEGPYIGSVGLPGELQHALTVAPALELRAAPERRIARLLAVYGGAPRKALCAALARTRGLDRADTARATAAVRAGRLADAIALILPAFDSAYRHRSARAVGQLLGFVEDDGAPGPDLAARAVRAIGPSG